MDGGGLLSVVRMESILSGHSGTDEQATLLGITSFRIFSSRVKELEVVNVVY